jgi:hypothetical protein
MQQSKNPLAARDFERTFVNANALLHCRGCFQTVRIVDYSQGGLQLARTFGLFRYDLVQVALTSGISLPARVAWSLGNRSGIAFPTPIDLDHPAMIELARKAGKALGELAMPIANAHPRKPAGGRLGS